MDGVAGIVSFYAEDGWEKTLFDLRKLARGMPINIEKKLMGSKLEL